jgi:hypothetical protein
LLPDFYSGATGLSGCCVRDFLSGALTRTALGNQVRGLLAEYGIVIAQGVAHLRRALPLILEDGANGLSGVMRELLREIGERLKFIEERLRQYDLWIQRLQLRRFRSVAQLRRRPGDWCSVAFVGEVLRMTRPVTLKDTVLAKLAVGVRVHWVFALEAQAVGKFLGYCP